MKRQMLTSEETAQFCAQMALLQSAGAAHDDALDVIARDAREPLRSALIRARELLEQGEGLDRALEETGAFPEYMVHMVEIGRVSGTLDRVFPALEDYYRREAELSAAVCRTAVYPAVLAGLIAAVFLVLLTKVLPVFRQVFAQLGMDLPASARLMLSLGSASRVLAGVFAALLALCALAGLWMLCTRSGRSFAGEKAAAFSAKTVWGRERARSRFAGAMTLMLSSGLGLDESIDRAENLLSGGALCGELKACRGEMDRGGSFSQAVERAGLFNSFDCGLLSAAFRAGAGEKGLNELAGRCARRAEGELDALMNRGELILVVLLCAAVGLVLLSVMLPLLGVMTTIGG